MVGLFPSYIEGFGLAVLEQLACGIPTVAYDVSGPRQILDSLRALLLVPKGDAATMAARAVEILRMNMTDYAVLSEKCRDIAARFRWETSAMETAEQYRQALHKLKPQNRSFTSSAVNE
jgi:glycosyltransferase involved in cell wall biosynthesis